MIHQRRFGLDDPDSLTRDAGLSVVRASSEIPDWILDDTASVASQIGLKRTEVGDFIGHKLLRRRRLFL